MTKSSISMAALGLALGLGAASSAFAAGGGGEMKDHSFSFEGALGHYDQAELQRGFQVYDTVCKACHGLQYLPIRDIMAYERQTGLGNAEGPRFSRGQAQAMAAHYEVPDPEGEPGDLRTALLSDNFPAVTSAGAPDLTLMAKARVGGPLYIYSLLTSYTGEEIEQAGSILYENHAFESGALSMAPPLSDDLVEYADESVPRTVEQYANDVAVFLAWAAEPDMVARKSAGLRNVIFLAFFSLLLWLTNKKLWKKIKHPEA
ncbi:cytochrome c1 [Neomegalonema perideroedes]|uniref:cytochrome c1 n=1 Tax=Neomegalonema perideroedes TaxID=217219 RepID=UPI0003804CCC|nr:cytochrome c1 [Neomegalonema perideroedes]